MNKFWKLLKKFYVWFIYITYPILLCITLGFVYIYFQLCNALVAYPY